MNRALRYRLTDVEKDALLDEQAALIERMGVRIAELEAAPAKPKKTSVNSHTPPLQDGPGCKDCKRDTSRPKKPRSSRAGVSRPLAGEPDKAERRRRVHVRSSDTATDQALELEFHRSSTGKGRVSASPIPQPTSPRAECVTRRSAQSVL